MPDFERLFEDSDGYWSRFFAREEVYDHEERSGFDSDHINNNSSNEEEHGEEHKEEASLTVHGLVSHPDQTIEAIDDAASLISSASSSSTTITTTTNCSSSSFSSSSSEPFQLIPRSSSEVPVWVTWKAGMEVMFFFDRSFDVRRAPAQVALLLNSGQFKSAINLAGDLNDNGLYHDCVDLSPVVHVSFLASTLERKGDSSGVDNALAVSSLAPVSDVSPHGENVPVINSAAHQPSVISSSSSSPMLSAAAETDKASPDLAVQGISTPLRITRTMTARMTATSSTPINCSAAANAINTMVTSVAPCIIKIKLSQSSPSVLRLTTAQSESVFPATTFDSQLLTEIGATASSSPLLHNNAESESAQITTPTPRYRRSTRLLAKVGTTASIDTISTSATTTATSFQDDLDNSSFTAAAEDQIKINEFASSLTSLDPMKRNTIGVDAINIRALLRDLSSKSSSPGVMVKLEEEEKSLSTQPDAANLLHISTCLIIRERMMLLLHLQPDEKDDGKALHQLYKDLNVEFNSAEDNAGAKKSKQLWQRKISYRYRLGNAWVEIIEVLLREKTVNMNEELYKKVLDHTFCRGFVFPWKKMHQFCFRKGDSNLKIKRIKDSIQKRSLEYISAHESFSWTSMNDGEKKGKIAISNDLYGFIKQITEQTKGK